MQERNAETPLNALVSCNVPGAADLANLLSLDRIYFFTLFPEGVGAPSPQTPHKQYIQAYIIFKYICQVGLRSQRQKGVLQ